MPKARSVLSLPSDTASQSAGSRLSLPVSHSTIPKAKSVLSLPSQHSKDQFPKPQSAASAKTGPGTARTGPHSRASSSSCSKTPGRNAAAKQAARRARKPAEGQVAMTLWRCPVCSIMFQGSAKYRHIKTRHPTEKYSIFIGKHRSPFVKQVRIFLRKPAHGSVHVALKHCQRFPKELLILL